ncbi:hypothetical protein OC25_17530 [Pedobacter kyungheensis]|uniref:Uncharacterized protein n=2 Tax=Pedobacter kyungheensis TaxID=1069985 RepID=A0A0C1DE70_9SPHI|nr:hypothetical protein OC25_17530 [Pedobacter kyungheensis]
MPVFGLALGLAALLALWAFRLARKVGGSSPPLEHRWQKGVDDLDGERISGVGDESDQSRGDSMMGLAVPDAGVLVLAADEFAFAGALGNTGVFDKSDQLGMLADVQQEIKSVCALLAQKDGGKQDFFTMFELVRQKYPRIAGHPAALELRPFIRQQVPFHLSDEELDNLWG